MSLSSLSLSTISNDTDNSSILDFSSEAGESINDEESLLAQHGYTKHKYLRKTLQGHLFTAINTYANSKNHPDYVAIKKTSKRLSHKREAKDKDGFNFIVDENIINEALTLRHLTVFNKPIGDSIVRYVDFFESDTHYYLVMEYIESNITLKEFVTVSHKYINENKLSRSQYQQIIKYLMWQLIATIHWLHNDMKCCHLDIVPENIMLNNAQFIRDKDGSISIDPRIGLKLADFGVSEMYKEYTYFECNKQHISLENEQYLSPNIYKQNCYDGAAADIWSYGMIVYFCIIGDYPYKTIEQDAFNEPLFGTGYWAICKNQLISYLYNNCLLKSFSTKTLSLVNQLLDTDETKRFKSDDVLQHPWFKSYYKRYSLQIKRKSNLQKRKSINMNQKRLL